MQGITKRCHRITMAVMSQAWTKGVLLGLGFTLAGMPAWATEPTEKEMREAVQAQFDNVNDASADTAERCNNREFNRGGGNPLLALECIGQVLGGGGLTDGGRNMKPIEVIITAFRKIACEKAHGKAGYLCDYVLGYEIPNNPTSIYTRAGSNSQGRFVKQGNYWVRLDE